MFADDWIARLAAGGKYTGIGLIFYTAYRLLVFGCTFIAKRLDAREARLNAQEERVDASLAKRLDHLERTEVSNQQRIGLLEECVAILASEVRQTDAGNPKLAQVARLLAGVHPVVPLSPQLDELLQHAANAVERRDKR